MELTNKESTPTAKTRVAMRVFDHSKDGTGDTFYDPDGGGRMKTADRVEIFGKDT
jgi:hypothetical protein